MNQIISPAITIEQLYHEYHQPLGRYLARLVIDRETAEDLCHGTFIKALRHWDEFALHVRAAKNNGLTDEEIGEVIQHAAIYAGVPAANHAFKVAAPILQELRGTIA